MWGLLPAGLVVVAGWVFWEKTYAARGRSPMVDLGLFRIGSYTMGTAVAGLYFVGVPSVWVLVAIYVQQGQGFSALEAGLLGLPAAICTAAGSHLAGLRVMECGRKIVIAGLLCALAGLLICIAVIELHAIGMIGIWWLLAGLAFLGLAQGAVIAPNQALTMLEVPLESVGSAGGVMQTSQRIATAVGMAMITAVFFATLAVSNWDVAMRVGLAAIVVVALATLWVAVADQRRRSRKVQKNER
ncbi:MFS transporter [Paeniglutamicibacter sp. NPDC091659]|uniref:MFS transporter n=1 Tax=Paeniglutamicibacter sp. NPDC091659 TaxID=3364389 RepID=UPI00382B35F4